MKTITVELSDEEHKKFVEICKKTGKRRSFFIKNAIINEIDKNEREEK